MADEGVRVTAGKTRRREAGIVLLVILVVLLVVAGTSASFIWFMNRQQARAGLRYRSGAALAVAEAGVHRALAILESVAPDGGPGRTWRPPDYAEALQMGPLAGRFTLSLAENADGGILITSTGEVSGVTRRLRARVYLASPSLLAALHGSSTVRLEQPPAATYVLPYGAGIGDRPWIHIAAGRGIWFATPDVSINSPTLPFEAGPGPLDAAGGVTSATALPRPGPVRILLARGATMTLGEERLPVDVQQLRAVGVYVAGVVFRAEALSQLPDVDRAFYQARAAANTENADLNEAAGRYLGDTALMRKMDSLYSSAQFRRLQTYLRTGLHPPHLQGVVYVQGGVELVDGQRLHISDGALVAESTVHLIEGSVLEVTHSAATRSLPGVVVLDNGALVLAQGSRLRAHGLVYANRVIDVGDGAHLDVVGAVLGNDRMHSFRNRAATVVIRYDPGVLGTPGLRVPGDTAVVAWVAAWEELP